MMTLSLLKRAVAIHATSEMEAADARILLPQAKIVVVPNGIDLAHWRPVPPLWSAAQRPPHKLTLAYVGRISPEKGILRFARLWCEMAEPGERLIVAGSGVGDYPANLKSLAASTQCAAPRVSMPNASLPSR